MKNDLGIPKIICNFPVLKEWKINAIQDTNSIWLPENAPIELCFKDFDINFVATVIVNDEGNIKPHFWEIHIKFGDSYFTHDNWFFAFTFHQFVKFSFLVIENTAFICGELILSEMGEPLLSAVFNNYRMPFPQMPTPFLGQGNDTRGDFELDWRLTKDPVIADGQMDLFMLGEYYQKGDDGCGELEVDEFDFLGNTSLSQVVITQAAATCMLNSAAKSPIGQVDLNEERLNKLYNITGLKFNTTSMAKHFPILKSKLGPNKPLKVKASISNAKVALGAFDVDVKIEYTLHLAWYLDLLGSPELLYDEVRMISSFNIKTHNDVLDIIMIDNKIKMDA